VNVASLLAQAYGVLKAYEAFEAILLSDVPMSDDVLGELAAIQEIRIEAVEAIDQLLRPQALPFGEDPED
jgi:hypothetical protein